MKGDVVVALVGGFFPYILRSRLQVADSDDNDDIDAREGSSQLVVSDSAYKFVGDCCLHGSMNGEDFKAGTHYRTDVSKIVDISIV